jgi:hypothetical protein
VPPIRLHDLRHTCATMLLAEGVHPKVVQERLGHAPLLRRSTDTPTLPRTCSATRPTGSTRRSTRQSMLEHESSRRREITAPEWHLDHVPSQENGFVEPRTTDWVRIPLPAPRNKANGTLVGRRSGQCRSRPRLRNCRFIPISWRVSMASATSAQGCRVSGSMTYGTEAQHSFRQVRNMRLSWIISCRDRADSGDSDHIPSTNINSPFT